MASCGKKGPPFMTQKEFSQRVVDLRGEWTEGYILLEGKIAGPPGTAERQGDREGMKGARVYYREFLSTDAPCEGCPMDYQGYHGFGPEVAAGEGFLCRVPGKGRGRTYFFQVQLMGPNGAMGPSSDRIRVDSH